MANYNKLTPELLEQLKNIVGADRFQAGEDINPDYAHDEMPIYGKYMPDWIEAGIKVVPVVPPVAIARRVERGGATAGGNLLGAVGGVVETDASGVSI